MAYTDPSTLTWAFEEFPSSSKMNSATNDQFLALFPNNAAAASWTPGLAATVGNPAVTTVGRRYRIGPLQFVWARFTITSAGGGDGFYFVTLPVAASGISASAAEGSGQTIGTWTIRDNSVPSSRNGSVLLRAADEAWFNLGPGTLTDLVPFTVTTDDVLSFSAVYPVA